MIKLKKTKPFPELIYKDALEELKGFCKVPRRSNFSAEVSPKADYGNKVRAYIIKKVKKYLGDKVKIYFDDGRNLSWTLPATKGYEKVPTTVLQAHQDMVWDVKKNSIAEKWDPYTHPVAEPVIESINGPLVMHTKDHLTSLGADDAAGMSMILSITKHHKEFPHGKIKCLFTADEESTIWGATHLGQVGGKYNGFLDDAGYLINLDLPHGESFTCTAAGLKCYRIEIHNVKTTPAKKKSVIVKIDHCMGGHSGENIDEGRLSAVWALGKELHFLNKKHKANIRLVSFNSTSSAMNKIPGDAEAEFVSDLSFEQLQKILSKDIQIIKKDHPVEKNFTFHMVEGKNHRPILTEKQSELYIRALNTVWQGPKHRFADTKFVGSSGNLSPCTWSFNADNSANMRWSPSIRFGKAAWIPEMSGYIKVAIELLTEAFGSDCVRANETENMPVWEELKKNKLYDLTLKIRKELGVPCKPMRCHGGLESAYFAVIKPKLQQISMGPTIENEHNCYETMYLDEYEMIAHVVVEILKRLK